MLPSLLQFLLLLVTLVLSASPVHADDDALGRIHPFGDFRYRAELTEYPDRQDRFRPRVRLRIGALADLGEGLQVGARLVTGDLNDPRTTHQTLGQGGGSFPVSLDRVYIEWRPQGVEGLRLRGGKFQSPAWRPTVIHDLRMDDDVQPTGVMAHWKGGSSIAVDASLGHYLLDENANSGESQATEAQVGVRFGKAEDLQVRVYADAFLMFVADGTSVDRLGHPTGRGNLVENGMFVSDFHVIQGFAEAEMRAGGQPLVVSAGVLHNLRAFEHKNDTGWFAGAVFGKVQSWGSGRVYAQWQEVEQEAVFTPWAGDDLPDDRGSRYRGVAAGAVAGLTQRLSVHVWGMATTLLDPGAGETDAWLQRYRIDLNARF